MASASRACRGDDSEGRGAGGKLLRPRRRAASTTPYSRQEEAPSALPSSQPEAKGWFSGIGRILTSVFWPESGSSTSCSGSSDSDSEDPEDDEHQNTVHRDDNMVVEPAKELVERQGDGNQTLFLESKTKLLIGKLLQQETYTSDESKKLTEIIHSRTVKRGKNGIGDDFSRRGIYSSTSSPRVFGSSFPHNYLLGRSPDSPTSKSKMHSNSATDQVCTPQHTNAAIIEAKKWVEEKRHLSGSKFNPSCGPCALNTDPFHDSVFALQESIDSQGSPIDIAKSYMQALPSWRSPISSNSGFTTPPVGHRRSHFEAFMDSVDVTQNMREKMDAASSSIPSTIGSSKKMSNVELCHTSSGPCENAENHFVAVPHSNSVQTRTLDDCTDEAPCITDPNNTKHNLPRYGGSAGIPLPAEKKVLGESSFSNPANENNQVVASEQPPLIEEQAGMLVSHKTSVAEHNGDLVEYASTEPIAVLSGDSITLLSVEEMPAIDIGIPTLQKAQEMENLKIAYSAEYHSFPDVSSVDKNNQTQKHPTALHSMIPSNGVPSHSGSSNRTGATQKSADSQATGSNKNKPSNSGEFSGFDCDADVTSVDDIEKNTIIDQPQLGITMKSIKKMLRELPANSSRGRSKKLIARRRGRRGGR